MKENYKPKTKAFKADKWCVFITSISTGTYSTNTLSLNYDNKSRKSHINFFYEYMYIDIRHSNPS
jgi:hypothetical protein